MEKLGILELNKVHHFNCLDEKALKSLPDNSVDVVITDPPYGLSKEPDITKVLTAWLNGDEYQHTSKGFMGREWDSFVPSPTIWKEVLRVLKHGGFLACFASTRTADLMGISLRIAGFEIKETIAWVYGSGFPKSVNLSKAIDKKLKLKREVIGKSKAYHVETLDSDKNMEPWDITTPAEVAKKFEGYGTALKPAHEPILIARKPLSEKTLVANVLKWGTGGMNIDDCRIPYDGTEDPRTHGGKWKTGKMAKSVYEGGYAGEELGVSSKGRFPANLILDEEAGQLLDEQTGILTSGTNNVRTKDGYFIEHGGMGKAGDIQISYGDSGGASRFFYCAKASKKERGEYNNHVSVKPLNLMKYLVRLLSPPNAVVLEPFAGSGTTPLACEELGFDWIAFEMEANHVRICEKRLEDFRNSQKERTRKTNPEQLNLFESKE